MPRLNSSMSHEMQCGPTHTPLLMYGDLSARIHPGTRASHNGQWAHSHSEAGSSGPPGQPLWQHGLPSTLLKRSWYHAPERVGIAGVARHGLSQDANSGGPGCQTARKNGHCQQGTTTALQPTFKTWTIQVLRVAGNCTKIGYLKISKPRDPFASRLREGLERWTKGSKDVP